MADKGVMPPALAARHPGPVLRAAYRVAGSRSGGEPNLPGLPFGRNGSYPRLVAALRPRDRRALLWLPADGSPRAWDEDGPTMSALLNITTKGYGLLVERTGSKEFRLLPAGQVVRRLLTRPMAE